MAVFSLVFLGEPLRPLGLGGPPSCASPGVVVLAGGRRVLQVRDRAVLFGIAAGGAFALASVGIRAASQSLVDGQDGDGHVIARALLTLAVMNTMQIVMHGGYLAVRERDQLRLSFVHWQIEFGGGRAQRSAGRPVGRSRSRWRMQPACAPSDRSSCSSPSLSPTGGWASAMADASTSRAVWLLLGVVGVMAGG